MTRTSAGTALGGLRQDGFRYVNIVQGNRGVSRDPQTMFTTVLGSCVAACLFDPDAKIGGMNHFLLAEPDEDQHVDAVAAQRYGVHAMELLINEMLQVGADRRRLRGHLYGGANLHAGMRAIGTSNAEFAIRFLRDEGIPLMAQNLGGTAARRVDFQPAHGRARCRIVQDTVADEVPRRVAPIRPAAPSGDLELF
ncbi:chemotaxis protein CheD [Sphingomonas quercus]|uniref:Probable chemoreceptor glutamine deamidase CheD n=1 Tax=Sphingomonas quercus TaxID=2842451 RepID=A0ABS6BDX0_9SPHN|nr:chemotaxis protein CheD [Sphingomonas quercus]MBU3076513.1 chemotaxis protein CheD [Sphingomonas quercus]